MMNKVEWMPSSASVICTCQGLLLLLDEEGLEILGFLLTNLLHFCKMFCHNFIHFKSSSLNWIKSWKRRNTKKLQNFPNINKLQKTHTTPEWDACTNRARTCKLLPRIPYNFMVQLKNACDINLLYKHKILQLISKFNCSLHSFN